MIKETNKEGTTRPNKTKFYIESAKTKIQNRRKGNKVRKIGRNQDIHIQDLCKINETNQKTPSKTIKQ